jgi:hypothetical protein
MSSLNSKPQHWFQKCDYFDVKGVLFPGNKLPITIGYEAGWTLNPVWTLLPLEKSLPRWDPDRPAYSQSIH